jgi:hypothetical protein
MKTALYTDFPAARIGRFRLLESARFPDLRNEANKYFCFQTNDLRVDAKNHPASKGSHVRG